MKSKEFDLKETFLLLSYLEQSGGNASIEELQKVFGCDLKKLKNIARVVNLLEVSPGTVFIMEVDEENNLVTLNSPYDFRIPFVLDKDEFFAFVFALAAFKEYVGDADEEYKTLIEKIEKRFPKILLDAAKEYLARHRPIYPKREVLGIVGILKKALAESRVIEVNYYSITKSSFSLYKICPLKISYFFRNFYLWAKDLKDGLIKSFIVDNITSVRITGEKYTVSEEDRQKCREKIEDFREKRDEKKVILKAVDFSAKYIEEMFFDLIIERVSDREVIFQVPLISTDWLVSKWLIPFSGEVSIVEPVEVAKEASKLVREVLAKYK